MHMFRWITDTRMRDLFSNIIIEFESLDGPKVPMHMIGTAMLGFRQENILTIPW